MYTKGQDVTSGDVMLNCIKGQILQETETTEIQVESKLNQTEWLYHFQNKYNLD